MQFLKSFLRPLPICHLFTLGIVSDLRMFLRIALKHTWAYQIDGIRHDMHQRLSVVDYESARCNRLLQPCHEMIG
ncbi:hypothetical protein NZ02_20895 [Xanthomonas phaseoli pv. phaseoli]|nr:hypothetical protein NZ02_20895 [Xanthomonas phaseoli pv. phaseoli]